MAILSQLQLAWHGPHSHRIYKWSAELAKLHPKAAKLAYDDPTPVRSRVDILAVKKRLKST